MNLEDLSSEQKAKARACKTTEELFALVQEEGLELSDEQLEAVSGGVWNPFEELDKFFDSCTSYHMEFNPR